MLIFGLPFLSMVTTNFARHVDFGVDGVVFGTVTVVIGASRNGFSS